MRTFSLGYIAHLVGGTVQGDGDLELSGVRPFDEAGPQDISCAMTPQYIKRLGASRAGAVIVPEDAPAGSGNLLRTDNPYAAFAKVIALFHPPSRPEPGVSPLACIGRDVTLGKEVSIAPGVVTGNGAVIGDHTVIMANVVLGDHVTIGRDVVLHPNCVVLDRCIIGDQVIIHAGTVIGSDGFGFAPDGPGYAKVPQTGTVQIDSNVEIGANNTIDRATFGKTWIKSGVKTDNLVHVGHNVTVGENTLLVAQVGVSGSTSIGRHVIIAGQAGIADHVQIGDNAVVAPQTGVAKSIDPGQVMSGTPAMPHRLWLRVQRVIAKLPDLAKEVRDLGARISKIEEKQP